MGRPKIETDKKLSKRFIFRLTENELKRLVDAAEVCGVTSGELARKKLFKGKFPQARIARIELETFVELRRIGVNLNQLTRLANAGRISSGIGTILMQLSKQQKLIIGQILNYDSHSENR